MRFVNLQKKDLPQALGIIFLILILSFPLISPYLHQGYFPTHDGEWAVVRLADMFRELRDFQIPARYSGNLNFGYGYPLFNFAYPLPYYIGTVIHMLGIGFVDTIKLLFALSIPLSGLFMFLASRNIWKSSRAGIVSVILYLYFPYRLVDLYVRGSLGESLGFVFFPLILYCLSKLFENPKSGKYLVLGGLSYAGLILSHNIMAVLFTISILIFFIGNFITKKYSIIKPTLGVFILGYLVSAFFWIPALLEKGNILLSQVPIADRSQYFVTLKELLFSSWGYGVPTDKVNGFTYQIGWPFILVVASAFGLAVYRYKKKSKPDSNMFISLAIIVGSIFMILAMFSFAGFFWKLPILSEINYPWTMLSQIGVIISLLAGYLVKDKLFRYAAFVAVLISLVLYIPLAKPSNYMDRGDGMYFTNDATTTSSHELMPLWVKEIPFQRPDHKLEILKGDVQFHDESFSSNNFSFNAVSEDKSDIKINTIYYPGWVVYVNGKKAKINYSNPKGVMVIGLEKGESNIKGEFRETPIRLLADIISLGGIVLVVIILLKDKYRYGAT